MPISKQNWKSWMAGSVIVLDTAFGIIELEQSGNHEHKK